jgi:hypothetical protein
MAPRERSWDGCCGHYVTKAICAGNSGEPTPETVERIDLTRQLKIQWLMDHYQTQIRMLQDKHKEKRAPKHETQKLIDIGVQKITNTKL